MSGYGTEFSITDLQKISLFKGVQITEDNWEKLTVSCHSYNLKRNQTLPLVIDKTQYMYYVLSGYLSTQHPTDLLPWDTFFIGWRGPGHILGEMRVIRKELLECNELSGVIIKATDDCKLLQMPAHKFTEVALDTPMIYKNFTDLMIDKILEERRRSEVSQISSKKCRVAKALMNLYEERGCRPGTSTIAGTIKTAHLAGYIGASRWAVTDNLKKLEQENIISLPRSRKEEPSRGISILNLRALTDACYPY